MDRLLSEQEVIKAVNKHTISSVEIILSEDITAILKEVSSAEPKWIPVSERLPDKLQDVLITFYDAEGEYDVAYMRKTFNETYKAHGSENEWVSSMGETTYADYEVSAWMPIEPYKAGSEDKND